MIDDPFKEANRVAKESFYDIFAKPLFAVSSVKEMRVCGVDAYNSEKVMVMTTYEATRSSDPISKADFEEIFDAEQEERLP